MVKSFKIIILNPAKAGRIKDLRKINGRQGFKITEFKECSLNSDVELDGLLFTLTKEHTQKTIKKSDVELFVPILLKGKGCKVDEDYKLEIEE